ncbi:uncharacterized protein LOC114256904 [Camellia sinensis]|uniref:uncharacterized protein LOC114256904 n=1 Tax=Camellia sinensis TaxID=4442 RepID=UPI001035DBA6|nr:uncharacterized protein LOC114256904 [Camellia sinensis]
MTKELVRKSKEAAGFLASLNNAEAKMKMLLDQAEAAKKAQDQAEEKAEATEAVAEVFKAQVKEVEAKTAEAQAKLRDALATKEAEIKAADEKAFSEGQAAVSPNNSEDKAEDEDPEADDADKGEAAIGVKSPTLNEQVLDFTQDDEDEISKSTSPKKATTEAEVQAVEKSLDQTLFEIDAEIATEKESLLPTEAQRQ